jgi:hypothetical protein
MIVLRSPLPPRPRLGLALLTTAPGLDFLNSISGLTEESLDALPDVIAVFAAANASAPSLATGEPTLALADGLRRLGFTAGQPRPVGTIDLLSLSAIPAEANDLHVPVAAAAFSVHRNAAVFGGAATVPAARRLGAQTALLNHRLIQAAVAGAHAAVVTAAPESASARNLARAGFKIRRRHGWN